MKTRYKPIVTADQQAVLDGVALRLVTAEEREAFDEQLVRGHYLNNVEIVGEQLRYVAENQGQWIALMIGDGLIPVRTRPCYYVDITPADFATNKRTSWHAA